MEQLKLKNAIRQNVVTNQIFLLRNYETKKTKKKLKLCKDLCINK